jgi:ArsR family transcriptional regulator
MKTLGEENRCRIAMMLLNRTMCVCEIATVLDISMSAVSRHLKEMTYAGIVKGEKDGRWISYSITGDPVLRRLLAVIDGQLRNREPLKSDREQARTLEREECAISLRGGKET